MTVRELRQLLFSLEDQDAEIKMNVKVKEEHGVQYRIYADIEAVSNGYLIGTDEDI